jgi:hypothetical protein
MAGSSDCIMSLSRWQPLMARITPNTVVSACGLDGSAAVDLIAVSVIGLFQ